jgi:hypothetical protein
MRRSRFAQAGFIVLFVAGCSSAATPAPTAAIPASASPSPTAVVSSATPAVAPSPGASASPSPTPSTTVSGWQQVPAQPALTAAQTTLVIWTGQRFLAAGLLDDGSTGILDSSDGQTWHTQAGFGPGARILNFSVGPAGVLAVGAQDTKARSWFSTDGLTWRAAPDSAALRPAKSDSIQMAGAVATPAGWLAVGQEVVSCEFDCGSWAAVRADVWTSKDGLIWTREPASSALANAAMAGVVKGGPGYVAAGSAPDKPTTTEGPVHAVVWTSADGSSWTRVKDAPVFHAPADTDQRFGATMSGIATAGNRLVAVGTVASQDDVSSALAWWSDDGRTWQRGTGERFHYGQLWQVADVPGGFLGTGPSGPDSCLGGIWSSADGKAWSCVAADSTFDGSVAADATASPTVELVVGYDPSGGGSILWTRPVP